MNRLLLLLCLLVARGANSQPCVTNVALGLSATASSTVNNNYAGYATDGNLSTRWESQYSDPQQITIDLGVAYQLCQSVIRWEGASAQNFTLEVSSDGVSWTTAATVNNNATLTNTLNFTQTGRYVRVNGTARTTSYGYSIYEFEVYGSPVTPFIGINVSLGKPAFASSSSGGNIPDNAVDNSSSTRWESVSSDPQYFYVDLQASYHIDKVTLLWEAAYARNFELQFSSDASAWTTAYSYTGNVSLVNNIPVGASARYVRIYGTERATGYGYSLFDVGVYGSNAVLAAGTTDFRALKRNGVVGLQWQTPSAMQSTSFLIERKTNSRSLFTPIGSANRPTLTGGKALYQWTDANPESGVNFYRLAEKDSDGLLTYSSIVSVDMGQSGNPVSCWYNSASDRIVVAAANGEQITIARVFLASGSSVGYQASGGDAYKEIKLLQGGEGLFVVQCRVGNQVKAFKVLRKNHP